MISKMVKPVALFAQISSQEVSISSQLMLLSTLISLDMLKHIFIESVGQVDSDISV